MAKRGRPQKPFETSWGEMIPGLYKCNDGRWRITETGRKFTEPDERRAVAKFRAEHRAPTVGTPTSIKTILPSQDADGRFAGPIVAKAETKAEDFWPWLREQLIEQPGYVAKMVGIPELAQLAHLPLPKAAITIDKLITTYEQQNPSTAAVKRRAAKTMRRLAKFTKARTLDDLTQEQLQVWRESVENDPKLKSAGTRAQLYGQVKTVISFGLKSGLDQAQVRAALDRCRVLWTAEPLPAVKPEPISRNDFHTLLAAADETWRAWLLLAMNLAMTAEDLCSLRWDDFDFDAGTYAAIRVKTRRDRIPRAGVLWDETREAMSVLPRRSEFVFTSPHGSRYSKNSRVNLFATLRERAGLPKAVKLNHIRDAAYTEAARGCDDERWARVLAGHRAAGLQDNYVLRNPEAVRPACKAIYKKFGPF